MAQPTLPRRRVTPIVLEDFIGRPDDQPLHWTVTKAEPFDPTLDLHRALGVEKNDRLAFVLTGNSTPEGLQEVTIQNLGPDPKHFPKADSNRTWEEPFWALGFNEHQVELTGTVQLPVVPNELKRLVNKALPKDAPPDRRLLAEFGQHLAEAGSPGFAPNDLAAMSRDELFRLLRNPEARPAPASVIAEGGGQQPGVVGDFTLNIKYLGNSTDYPYLKETGCASADDKIVAMLVFNNRFKHLGGEAHVEH